MKTIAAGISIAALLTGCNQREPNMNLREESTQSIGRVTVTRIGVFKDEMSYYGQRGIYVIKDNQTGSEFIGVSGVGIAELGSHMSGKVRVRDER